MSYPTITKPFTTKIIKANFGNKEAGDKYNIFDVSPSFPDVVFGDTCTGIFQKINDSQQYYLGQEIVVWFGSSGIFCTAKPSSGLLRRYLIEALNLLKFKLHTPPPRG